jgi:hypothetical protein
VCEGGQDAKVLVGRQNPLPLLRLAFPEELIGLSRVPELSGPATKGTGCSSAR